MALTKKDLTELEEKINKRINLLPTKKELLHEMDRLHGVMKGVIQDHSFMRVQVERNEYNIDINSQRLDAIENRFKSHQTHVVS